MKQPWTRADSLSQMIHLQLHATDYLLPRVNRLLDAAAGLIGQIATDNTAPGQDRLPADRRKAIAETFERELAASFCPEPVESGPLRLRDPEIGVAVAAMAERAEQRSPVALQHLRRELAAQLPEHDDPDLLPLTPASLCRVFERSLDIPGQDKDGAETGTLPLATILILLKQFERDILANLRDLLDEALAILSPQASSELDIFDDLSPLELAAPAPGINADLDRLQRYLTSGSAGQTAAEREIWRRNVRALAQGRREENTINAVFMLFDYLLERQPPASTLTARFLHLQIPVIKTALQDAQFIRDPLHPARQLLKTVAQALRDRRPGQDSESVQQALETTLQQLRAGGDLLDADQCRAAEQAFIASLTAHGVRQQQASERVRAGQAADQDIARALVDRMLQEKLQGKTIVREMIGFFAGPWTSALIRCLQRHGNTSLVWQDALSLTLALAQSVEPHPDTASLAFWVKQLPGLVRSVTSVLDENLTGPERDAALDILWEAHAALLKSDPALSFVTLDFHAASTTAHLPESAPQP